MVAFIVKDSGELRRAVLKGPFFEKTVDSTFTLVLDQYGEKVVDQCTARRLRAAAPDGRRTAAEPRAPA